MRNVFVETSNVREFYASLKKLDDRGAEEACLVVVDGKPGLGKTTTLNRWVTQTGSIYLRAQVGWDYSWFIQEVLAELSVDPKSIRGKRNQFARMVSELQDRAYRAALRDKTFGIVIDECDLVSSRAEIMEAIRGISDLKHLPTILVGMGTLRDNLRRFPQIESRGPNKCTFLPATIEDARALIRERCEVPVAEDLIQYVWRASRGFNREMLDAIAHIERFGLRAEIDDDGVTLADMAGQPIMTDRTNGKEIIVTVAA